jgi:hypothetical protein
MMSLKRRGGAEPDIRRSPRHRLPCDSSNEGRQMRRMTRRGWGRVPAARSVIAGNVTQDTRVSNVEDDVAGVERVQDDV